MARRASDWDVIPLCPTHHRGKTGVHGLGTKGFPKHWGFTEHDLLDEVRGLIKEIYGVSATDKNKVVDRGVE